MSRGNESALGAAATFELSTAERRLVAERLRAVHDHWADRLQEPRVGQPAFSVYELANLYDNLLFDTDHLNSGENVQALDRLIERLDLVLEQGADEFDVPEEHQALYEEIVSLIDRFCEERLNEEYRKLCRKAAAALCQDRSPAVRGKRAGWASGVVYAIGWVNFLNDPSQEPHVRSEEIAKWFGVSMATMQSKSKVIREGLNLSPFDPNFTLSSRMAGNPLASMLNIGGFLEALQGTLGGAAGSTHEPLRIAADGGGAPQGGWVRTRQASAATPSADVFQIKITLKDVKPAVWRRVQTPDCTLEELHDVIQTAMGWHNCHMHEFQVGETRFVTAAMDEFEEAPEGSRREADVLLSELFAAGAKKFNYMYDFGDGWEHAIAIEKTLARSSKNDAPMCLAGARACPPEDIGGPWGYPDFLEAMADATHERHEELSEWYGAKFDPAAFDVAEVNRLLGR
ncbi:MAG: plasmid pRiA4b ORF-3 family protein [Pirellulales bacterium]|nr:plasmid pRiA4b ORF-3 family protein [Pirellulales bacterium]